LHRYTTAARALLRAGQKKEAVDLLAKLPDVGKAIDGLRTAWWGGAR
jgi:hypothetical protein